MNMCTGILIVFALFGFSPKLLVILEIHVKCVRLRSPNATDECLMTVGRMAVKGVDRGELITVGT